MRVIPASSIALQTEETFEQVSRDYVIRKARFAHSDTSFSSQEFEIGTVLVSSSNPVSCQEISLEPDLVKLGFDPFTEQSGFASEHLVKEPETQHQRLDASCKDLGITSEQRDTPESSNFIGNSQLGDCKLIQCLHPFLYFGRHSRRSF